MMEGQGNFCRGCLIQYEESNELLQYTEKNRRQFFYTTGLQVKCNDALSFQLCKECYISMKVACKFRKQCRSSDKRLKNYLALKAAGESIDFCTFLTNTDDTFRFPINGFSTPSHNKLKDDDNESTTTSIRNFMTDMMESEEIPDMEASIIREVIAEEADLIDDSLDSHWLRDDVSIDTDFHLDLSLSPFSPSRSVHNDHCYSPLRDLKPEEYKSMPSLSNILASKKINKEIVPDTIDRNLAKAIKNDKDVYPLDELIVSPATEYPDVSTPTITDILSQRILTDDNETDYKQKGNLDNFTRDKDIGKYLDENSQSNLMPRVGQCIETFENVEGDTEVIEDFFKTDEPHESIKLNFYVDPDDDPKETQEIKKDKQSAKVLEISKDKKELRNSDRSENRFKCPLCEFACKLYRLMVRHTVQSHDIELKIKRKEHLCSECGRHFTDVSNYKRHLVRHEKEKLHPDGFHCDICKRVFTSRSKIEVHMQAHVNIFGRKSDHKPKNIGKFICQICGSMHNAKSNYLVHLKRHQKNYDFHCVECGKGFYRKYDFDLHMRSHTKAKPFACNICGKKHATTHMLQRHIRSKHTDEKPFQCEYCSKRFVLNYNLLVHVKSNKKCHRLRRHMEKQYIGDNKETVYKINDTH